MREIKFRGKDSDTGEWRYGFYLQHEKLTILGGTDEERKENTKHYIVFDGFSDWNMPRALYRADVDGKTVGQYTGVHDGDGKEIYEGDIVITYMNIRYVVKWIDKYARFAFWKPDIVFSSGLIDNGNFKSIGNIYDNPELIRGAGYEADT